MKALLDNKEVIFNDRMLLMGEDINGRKCPVADHSGVANYGTENFKVISHGHVYVLNYNKDTFIPKSPMTFEEYINNKNK